MTSNGHSSRPQAADVKTARDSLEMIVSGSQQDGLAGLRPCLVAGSHSIMAKYLGLGRQDNHLLTLLCDAERAFRSRILKAALNTDRRR